MSECQYDLEEIYNQYYQDVYHFAIYYTNNPSEAEDITQETFIKVMRNLSHLKSSEKIKTWIFSIAKNTAIDYKRKQRTIPYLPEHFLQKKSNELPIDHHIEMKEDWETLQKALLFIKPLFRSLIILRGIKELSVKETATIVGCTELKIRVDYHRAVKQLSRQVEKIEERWGAVND